MHERWIYGTMDDVYDYYHKVIQPREEIHTCRIGAYENIEGDEKVAITGYIKKFDDERLIKILKLEKGITVLTDCEPGVCFDGLIPEILYIEGGVVREYSQRYSNTLATPYFIRK
jgi:hypothetical protein